MAPSQNAVKDPEHHNIVNGTHAQLIFWLIMNVWTSHFGLPVLVAIVVFSKKVQRHPTFVNLCLTFIVIGLSSSILLYAGRTTGPEPSPMLCLFQASLLYGMPALSSIAVFMLVFQMFLVIYSTLKKKDVIPRGLLQRWGMLWAPWIAWLISVLATASVGASNPQNVSRNRRFFYCSVRSDPLTNTLMVVAAVALVATLVFEVWSLMLFYKRWVSLRGKESGRKTLSMSMELNLAIRVLAFGFYVIVCLSLSLLSISTPESPIPDLVIASAATVVILIFGTQPDILRAVCFWHKESSNVSSKTGNYITEIKTPVSEKVTTRVWPGMFTRLARFYK